MPPALAPLGLRICRIEAGGALAGLPIDARRSEATYLRLLLPAALAGDYRRLLYLDSDVFVQGGDFGGLLGVDLGGRPLAAVRDNFQWRRPGRHVDSFRAMKLPKVPYFNAGVLLVDTAAFEAAGLLARCVEFAASHADDLLHMDQDVLNGVMMGEWAELSPVWNWQYTRATMLFEAMEGANVVHFIGAKKPWTHTGGQLPRRFRDAYRAFFARVFPERPEIAGGLADGLAPHQNRRYLREVLVRHALAVGSFCDYLDRFDSELAVLDAR
jgi:lipopolysaccharide biosynthesis glycosyltransferase